MSPPVLLKSLKGEAAVRVRGVSHRGNCWRMEVFLRVIGADLGFCPFSHHPCNFMALGPRFCTKDLLKVPTT